jgi:hypothetical protein
MAVLGAVAAVLLSAVAPATAEMLPGGEVSPLAINTFRNQASKRCLDDSFAYGPRPYLCNGLDFQKWSVRVHDDLSREFRNVNTGRCLGADRTGQVYAGGCGNRQTSWAITRWSDGTMQFQNMESDGCLMDTVWLSATGCDASEEQSWY